MTIEAASNEQLLKFTIADSGQPFDPTLLPDAETSLPAKGRNIGGLGMHIIRQFMDSVNYEHLAGKNILTIGKKRASL